MLTFESLQQQLDFLREELAETTRQYKQKIDRLQRSLVAFKESQENKAVEAILNLQIKDIGLSARTTNLFLRNDIFTIRDLNRYSYKRLNTIHGYGIVCEYELRDRLKQFGITLPED